MAADISGIFILQISVSFLIIENEGSVKLQSLIFLLFQELEKPLLSLHCGIVTRVLPSLQ